MKKIFTSDSDQWYFFKITYINQQRLKLNSIKGFEFWMKTLIKGFLVFSSSVSSYPRKQTERNCISASKPNEAFYNSSCKPDKTLIRTNYCIWYGCRSWGCSNIDTVHVLVLDQSWGAGTWNVDENKNV